MSYYLGKLNMNEFLILKDDKKIKFTLTTKTYVGSKKYHQINYLNVLNPDNQMYNIETEIDDYLKNQNENKNFFCNFELKSNIIFDKKQFIQFKINNDVSILPETNLLLDIEIDRIKLDYKKKTYQIILNLESINMIQ